MGFRGLFKDITTNLDANKTVVNFIKEKVEATMQNKDYAKVVTDFNYPFATRRPTLNTDYYETFNKDNVELIDISKDLIKEITKTGISTLNNNYEFDIIVFATGYDAITGALLSIDMVGKNNIKLSELWKNGPSTYLGLQVPGFPNFFTITGPGSPSVLTNVPMAIEQHVEFITDCISHMEKNNFKTIFKNPSLLLNKDKRSIKFHFDMMHGFGNLDKAIELLDPEEKNDFTEFVNTNVSFNPQNMFICKSKKILTSYYDSIFPWLLRCEKIFGFNNLKGYDQIRLYAYLSERYLPFWFEKYTNSTYSPWKFIDINLLD